MAKQPGTVGRKKTAGSANRNHNSTSKAVNRSASSKGRASRSGESRSSSGKNTRSSGSNRSRSSYDRTRSAQGTGTRRVVKQTKPQYDEPVFEEVILLLTLVVSGLMLLSIFGKCGRIGAKAANVLFGLFGSMSLIIPFILLPGVAFYLVNRKIRLAYFKIFAATMLLLMVMALFAVYDDAFAGISSLKDSYVVAASSHSGGGLLGYAISFKICRALGKGASTLIFAGLAICFFVLMTGKRVFIRLFDMLCFVGGNLLDRWQDFVAKREELAIMKQEEADRRAALEEEAARAAREAGHDPEGKAASRKKSGRIRLIDDSEDDLEEDLDDEDQGRKEKSAGEAEGTAPAQPKKDRKWIMSRLAQKGLDMDDYANADIDVPEEEIPDPGEFTVSVKKMDEEGPKKESLSDDPEVYGRKIEPVKINIPDFMKGSKLRGSDSVETQAGASPDDAENKADGSPLIYHRRSGSNRGGRITEEELEAFGQEQADAGQKEDKDPVSDPFPAKAVRDGLPEDGPSEEGLSEAEEAAMIAALYEEDEKPAKRPARKKKAEPDMPVMDEGEPVKAYIFPPLELLEQGETMKAQSMSFLEETAAKLEATLESFDVHAKITDVSCGPTVTRYELQPEQGVKIREITSLSDDIKMNLAAENIRIEAPIPGKAAVGIEVPNKRKEMVRLRDLLSSAEMKSEKSKIAFAAGKDIGGRTIIANIEKMPHLLIAGATGSGKSVCINTIILSILYRAKPDEVKLIMIDPKVVELSVYNGIPHLLTPVVTDPKQAAGVLQWAVETMMLRYQLFADLGVKNIFTYNQRIDSINLVSEKHKRMPQIVIIIDELADLMMVASKEVEDMIMRLAQLARAAGIHLIIATQRPSVKVITGGIKANVPSRLAFAVSAGVDSRTILDANGAEKLLGNGDMLFHPQGAFKAVRAQGAFVSEEEIKRVTDFIRSNVGDEEIYSKDVTERIQATSNVMANGASADSGERDQFFEEAGRFIIEKGKASAGMLQRTYKIGFNRAARIIDQLFDAGVVGPDIGTKPRNVHMTMEEFEQYLEDHE